MLLALPNSENKIEPNNEHSDIEEPHGKDERHDKGQQFTSINENMFVDNVEVFFWCGAFSTVALFEFCGVKASVNDFLAAIMFSLLSVRAFGFCLNVFARGFITIFRFLSLFRII